MNVPGSMKGCVYTHKIILGSSSSGLCSAHLLNTHLLCIRCASHRNPHLLLWGLLPLILSECHWFRHSENTKSKYKAGWHCAMGWTNRGQKGHLCPQKTKTQQGAAQRDRHRGAKVGPCPSLCLPLLCPHQKLAKQCSSKRLGNSSSGSSAPLCMATSMKKCFNFFHEEMFLKSKQRSQKYVSFSVFHDWKTLWACDLPNTGLSLSRCFPVIQSKMSGIWNSALS